MQSMASPRVEQDAHGPSRRSCGGNVRELSLRSAGRHIALACLLRLDIGLAAIGSRQSAESCEILQTVIIEQPGEYTDLKLANLEAE